MPHARDAFVKPVPPPFPGDTPGSSFLFALSSKLAAAQAEDAAFEALALTAIEEFASTCAVHTIDQEGHLELAGFAHTPAHKAGGVYRAISWLVASEIASVKSMFRSSDPVVLPIASDGGPIPDWQRKRDENLLEAFDGQSLVLYPMVIGASIVGVTSFARPSGARPFDRTDIEMAAVATRFLTLPLENMRSMERERRVAKRFGYLIAATNALFGALEPHVVFQDLANELVAGLADGIFVYFADGERLRLVATAHRDSEVAKALATITDTYPLTRTAERQMLDLLRAARPIYGRGGEKLERGAFTAESRKAVETLEVRDCLNLPIANDGAVAGAIVAFSSRYPFSDGDREIFEEIARRASLQLNHAQNFARERRLTKILQEAALPTQLPSIRNVIISSAYRPADSEVKVGGDWYDAFSLDENRVVLSIGDVTGHGLEASIIMSKLRHSINAVAMFEEDPARIIDAAEQVLQRRFPNGIATAFVGIYDARDRSILYANAGHPAPFVRFEDGSVRQLDATPGLPIGLRQLAPPSTSTRASLEEAVLLALYTDGLIESRRDALEGTDRLETCIKQDAVLHANNAAAFLESSCLDDFAPDDVAIVVLRFAAAIHWTFDAGDATMAHGVRMNFVSELRKRAVVENEIAAAELILGELLGNVRRHAPGRADVTLEFQGRQAIVHVRDRGPGLNPERQPLVDSFSEDGRGLWLVQQLSPDVRIEFIPRFGSHVVAVLPVTIAPGAEVES